MCDRHDRSTSLSKENGGHIGIPSNRALWLAVLTFGGFRYQNYHTLASFDILKVNLIPVLIVPMVK